MHALNAQGCGGARRGEHADPGADHRRRDPNRRGPGPKSRKRLPAGGPSAFVNPAQATTAPALIADHVRGVTRPPDLFSPRETLQI
jgi:hypothetical protein